MGKRACWGMDVLGLTTRLFRASTGMLPTLRFRSKITLGILSVLLISAVSLCWGFFGFQKVADSVAVYRTSVSEAELARDIDREIVAYQLLTRLYVVSGKEDDARAALASETALKALILKSMKMTTSPARLDRVTRLEREFRGFTRLFADILKTKRASEVLIQNRITLGGTKLRFRIDDLVGASGDQPVVEMGAKKVASLYLAAMATIDGFALKPVPAAAASGLARLKFVDAALHAIDTDDSQLRGKISEINDALAGYDKAFQELVAASKRLDELVADIADATQAVVQQSDAISADLLAEQRRLDSETDTAVHNTEQTVAALALGGLILGGLLAWLLGTGISRPMTQLCRAMRKLAAGDFEVVLPGIGRSDELGDMASAVEGFKIQAIAKAERDAGAQDAQNRAQREARRAELIGFADQFEAAVGSIVTNVSTSSEQLETAAGLLTRTADTTRSLAGLVADTSEQASSNMQTVASATNELSASVSEIGRRAQESSKFADNAVAQARQTDARIGELSRAAAQIGDVVKLITAIAEQTNLLALNATIEAARAGDAGRGFAVVASEVKLLAGQTARATDDISSYISSIQAATQDSVVAIKAIGETISQISGIASAIAGAVEQQNGATREIARNIHTVAEGANHVAGNVTELNRGAIETGSASGQVLNSARALSAESSRLRRELDRFMANIRAA